MNKSQKLWWLYFLLVALMLLLIFIWIKIYGTLGSGWIILISIFCLSFLYWAQRSDPDSDEVPFHGRLLILVMVGVGCLVAWVFSKLIFYMVGAIEIERYPFGLVIALGLWLVIGFIEERCIRRYFKRMVPLMILNRGMFPYFALGFSIAFVAIVTK